MSLRRGGPRRPRTGPPPVITHPPADVVDLVPAEVAPVPDGLPAARAARLEALADSWRIQARIPGAGPDATMFYSAPPKPPPPRASVPTGTVPDPRPAVLEDPAPAGEGSVPPGTVAPALVRDWASRHDPRSLEFDLRSRLRTSIPLQDRRLEVGPVLDQGTTPPLTARDASGCVGMAVVAAANVLELATVSPYVRPSAGELLGRADALALYDRAQALDHSSATRPGGEPGTSVLAGMLAGREAGYWPAFLWALGTRDVAQAILRGLPVVLGVPWGASLDAPDVDGVLTPGGDVGESGHALAAVGLAMTRGGRPGPFFALQQSRGPDHGDGGLVYVHHRTLAGLLAGVGEAAVPVPPGGVQ